MKERAIMGHPVNENQGARGKRGFDTSRFACGKLPPDALARMLKQFKCADERVIVGPQVGIDAAVLDFGDKYLIVTSDPITFTTNEIGWYAVCVNCNDVAVMGGVPRWFFATLLLPENLATEKLVRSIFRDLKKACNEANIYLCGGHTEITPAVNQPVICGTMLGEAPKDRLITSAGAQPGDAIILTKGLGIEGTAILARECNKILCDKISAEILDKAKNFTHKPGISVVRDAALALEAGRITSMHDPTEGGVATALREIASASNAGLRIRKDALPIHKETKTICEVLKIDPLGLISSGALLITCIPENAEKILGALQSAGIQASRIGEITEASDGLILEEGGRLRPLPEFPRDELARYFSHEWNAL